MEPLSLKTWSHSRWPLLRSHFHSRCTIRNETRGTMTSSSVNRISGWESTAMHAVTQPAAVTIVTVSLHSHVGFRISQRIYKQPREMSSSIKSSRDIYKTLRNISFCVCVCVYLLHLGQLSAGVIIVSQVLLVPHQDDGDIGTEVFHLRRPLLGDIFCRGGGRRRRRRRRELNEWRWRRGGTIKRDRQCRGMMQNSSHDGLLCRLLEAKMF